MRATGTRSWQHRLPDWRRPKTTRVSNNSLRGGPSASSSRRPSCALFPDHGRQARRIDARDHAVDPFPMTRLGGKLCCKFGKSSGVLRGPRLGDSCPTGREHRKRFAVDDLYVAEGVSDHEERIFHRVGTGHDDGATDPPVVLLGHGTNLPRPYDANETTAFEHLQAVSYTHLRLAQDNGKLTRRRSPLEQEIEDRQTRAVCEGLERFRCVRHDLFG